MGMSNGGAVPSGALGVGGFDLEPTVPAASDIFRSLPALAAGAV